MKYQEDIIFLSDDFKAKIVLNRVSMLDASRLFHSEIEIKYFYEGNTDLLVDDDMIITQPGDIVIINPYEIHSTINLGEQRGKYHLFLISMDFFGAGNIKGFDLRHLLIRKQLRFKHLIRDNKRLQYILSQVAKEVETDGEYYRFVVQGLLLEFFALLMRDEVEPIQCSEVHAEAMKYYGIIEPALEKIRDSYAEKLNVSELADLCNVSKSHFCRIFKHVTNMTVVQYITDYRFKIANLMLMHSNNSIAEISRSCGFEDEGYFCRCYKKKYGISPNKNKAILSQK